MPPRRKNTGKRALSAVVANSEQAPNHRRQYNFDSHKFLTEAHQERHQQISLKRFVQGRAFNVEEQAWPEMHQALRRVGLYNLNKIIRSANKNIALEFLANAMLMPASGDWSRSTVRGKVVSFSEERINQFLGIKAPAECAVERRIRDLNDMDEERRTVEILHDLCREGAQWFRQTEGKLPSKFNQKTMKPLPKAWSHFVVQNIVTNSNVTEVTIKRAAIIQAIMAGESINFGRLIRNDIRRIAEERQGAFSLGHCALINTLCEMDGVERIHGDIDEPVKGILTYAWYVKQPVGPMPPEHQQHPNEPVEEHPQEMEEVLFPQPPPTPHFNTYNFAMANFAEDLAGMMLTDVPQFEQDFKSAADTYRQAHHQHPYTRY
ncbi:unnamed protein product [Trifolium pratense]|uniref:Uncharacterized protein n=1 Tax=Trifolium pratense TaxID=57577 RepID=A0ACB0M6Y8_TRIPR|nr:unnamed protein product [Trifolium pratense]